MNQEHIANQGSDTTANDHPLQSRTLASLTDDEIRSIAAEWLLAALLGTNAFALHIAHMRQSSIAFACRYTGKPAARDCRRFPKHAGTARRIGIFFDLPVRLQIMKEGIGEFHAGTPFQGHLLKVPKAAEKHCKSWIIRMLVSSFVYG